MPAAAKTLSVFGRPYCPNRDCLLPYRRVGDEWRPACACPPELPA